jgi:7,8-dihydroneopterin aldolase/epimerase/oxygenase
MDSVTDRIVLSNMRFSARHGVHDWERETDQPFEVDVELWTDLAPPGVSDDLARTVDYSRVYDVVASVVRGPSRSLLEAIAETIAMDLLAQFDVPTVVVRVRKPGVLLGGPLDHAGVEIQRQRAS